jgi:hypothetical protein
MKEIRDRLVEIWNAATEPTPESAVLITNLRFTMATTIVLLLPGWARSFRR